jgi:uncharacterized protein (TIGR03083 family)
MTATTEMADRRVREMIAAEQADFVSLARSLNAEHWSTPSLCRGWTVRDVIVHTAGHTHGNKRGPGEKRRRRNLSSDQIVNWLAEPVITMRHLAKFDAQVQLAELMIHQQDVRRALNRPRQIAAEPIVAVLEFGLTRAGSIATAGLRRRAKGLRLEATDIPWTHGKGRLVREPSEALLMALSGRAPDRGDLTETDGIHLSAPPSVAG